MQGNEISFLRNFSGRMAADEMQDKWISLCEIKYDVTQSVVISISVIVTTVT